MVNDKEGEMEPNKFGLFPDLLLHTDTNCSLTMCDRIGHHFMSIYPLNSNCCLYFDRT